MKRAASVLILIAVACVRADAALELKVTDGSSTVSFVDGGAGDTAPQAGILAVSYTLGSWSFSSNVVVSSPAIGSSSEAVLDLNSINVSSSAGGTLVITATDTGYSLPTSGLISLAGLIGGVTMGSVSYSSYINTSNTPFGTEHLIGDVSGSGGAFSGTVSGSVAYTSPNPFSLTTQASITHNAGGATSFNAVGTAIVPEPTVLGLLGLGFGIVGLASLRKRRKLG